MQKDNANINSTVLGLSLLAPRCDNVTTQRERRGLAHCALWPLPSDILKKRRLNHLGKAIIMDNETIKPDELLILMTTTLTGCDRNPSKMLQLIIIDMNMQCVTLRRKYLSYCDKQDNRGRQKSPHLSSWESWKPWFSLGTEESRLTLTKKKKN